MNKSSERPFGHFQITPVGPFRACTWATIVMEYTVGNGGLAVGGCLKIGLPNIGWSEPLTPYPRGCPDVYQGAGRQMARYYRCNTTGQVMSEGDGEIYLWHRCSQNILGPYDNWSWWITATVERTALRAGDQIIVTYGDRSWGEEGVRVQPWAEKNRVWFTAFVDPHGQRDFQQAEGSPVECAVVAGPEARCLVTVPSVLPAAGDVRIKLSLTDWGMDPVRDTEVKKAELFDVGGKPIETEKRFFVDGPLEEISVRAEGVVPKRVEVTLRDGHMVSGQANPVTSRRDMLHLYWGDLHCHSFYHMFSAKKGISDPCTSPSELLAYARDVAHLDFAALTDGRGALPDNSGWQEAQQAVIDGHEEGRFVALKGWEIQFGEDGHRNAIYRDAVVEANISDPAFTQVNVWGQPGLHGMRAALEYYHRRDDVLLIPHHPMVWMNWDVFDEERDRLVEIYSCWGSSEYERNGLWDKASRPGLSVQYALARGYKLGFVAGSDSHVGYVGRSLANADRHRFCCYKAGLTGVYAAELTRSAIFEALRNRRCYATTGVRMIVDFAVDGNFMGTVNEHRGRPTRRVYCKVIGTEALRAVEIVRDNEVIHRIEPGGMELEDEWTDASGGAGEACYYYLRVSQADGNVAWASPVWI